MRFERWGTFSVKDHIGAHALSAEVLLYDRLVLPRAVNPNVRNRWADNGWDPDRLDSFLNILKVDQPDGHALAIPWTEETEQHFEERYESARLVDRDAERFWFSAVLGTLELMPGAPPGTFPISVMVAYPGADAAAKDWRPNDQASRVSLTLALAHAIAVPAPLGKSDEELLREAAALADDAGFQAKRAALYEWQDETIRNGVPNGMALEQMSDLLGDYNAQVTRAVGQVYWKFAFTLAPIALTVLGGPLGVAAGVGAGINLVKFWVYDRKPAAPTGKPVAAAMFHQIGQDLGWEFR